MNIFNNTLETLEFVLLYLNIIVYLCHFIVTKIYSVKPKVDAIMYDIHVNGPVVGAMKVYDDFLSYKSGEYKYIYICIY